MQRFSLYHVHKIYARTEPQQRYYIPAQALLYPNCNALRGDNNLLCNTIEFCEQQHVRTYGCSFFEFLLDEAENGNSDNGQPFCREPRGVQADHVLVPHVKQCVRLQVCYKDTPVSHVISCTGPTRIATCQASGMLQRHTSIIFICHIKIYVLNNVQVET